MNEKIIVYDGKNFTLGRLSSNVAKKVLLGNKVVIVNCDAVVVTGKRRTTIDDYKAKRQLGSASLHGPFFPKEPRKVVKRTIRGMLSHRQGRGKDALKRVKCYNDVPEEFAKMEMVKDTGKKNAKVMKLKELEVEI